MSDTQTDQAIEFMRAREDRARPFFLMVSPHPPHPPWTPEEAPPGYLERIREDLRISANVPKDFPLDRQGFRCYLAMAKNVDDNLGRIMSYLDASGFAEDTIVIFTSDHGEMFGSHGRLDKMVPYAEALDVPLLVRWPGHIPAGMRSKALFTPLDFFPTLTSLCGVKAPEALVGEDLSAVALEGAPSKRRAALTANYSAHWDYFRTGTPWPEWRGVRTETHTYARWLDGREELYDNVADPYQFRDLAGCDNVEESLIPFRRELDRLLEEANDDFPPGTAYSSWFGEGRELVRTARGPVRS